MTSLLILGTTEIIIIAVIVLLLFGGKKLPESYEPLDATFFFGEGADSVCLNPVQYFGTDIIKKCAMMHDSGTRTEKLLQMWSRVKGDNASPLTAIIILIAVIGFAAYGIQKKRKKRR